MARGPRGPCQSSCSHPIGQRGWAGSRLVTRSAPARDYRIGSAATTCGRPLITTLRIIQRSCPPSVHRPSTWWCTVLRDGPDLESPAFAGEDRTRAAPVLSGLPSRILASHPAPADGIQRHHLVERRAGRFRRARLDEVAADSHGCPDEPLRWILVLVSQRREAPWSICSDALVDSVSVRRAAFSCGAADHGELMSSPRPMACRDVAPGPR